MRLLKELLEIFIGVCTLHIKQELRCFGVCFGLTLGDAPIGIASSSKIVSLMAFIAAKYDAARRSRSAGPRTAIGNDVKLASRPPLERVVRLR